MATVRTAAETRSTPPRGRATLSSEGVSRHARWIVTDTDATDEFRSRDSPPAGTEPDEGLGLLDEDVSAGALLPLVDRLEALARRRLTVAPVGDRAHARA